MPCLYLIINTVDDIHYIGASKQKYEVRWKHHCTSLRRGRHSNKALQADWTRHGEDAFVFELLQEFDEAEDAFRAEVTYIQAYRDKGAKIYNVNSGRNGARKKRVGKGVSQAEQMRSHWQSQEMRDKFLTRKPPGNKKPRTEEDRRKTSEALKAKWASPEYEARRQARSEALKLSWARRKAQQSPSGEKG